MCTGWSEYERELTIDSLKGLPNSAEGLVRV